MTLIFIGAPGSGKGTQAKKLEAKNGHRHISTGDILREEISRGTTLGQKIQGILKQGELVDDITVLELLQENCRLDMESYIFDGFPRNISQAKLLEEKLLKGYPHRGVYFNMPLGSLVKRLTSRRVCRNCGAVYNLQSMPPKETRVCDHCGSNALYQRDDDQEEVIQNRLNVYNDTIGPVLDYYRSRGILLEVAANQGPDKVFNELEALLEEEE